MLHQSSIEQIHYVVQVTTCEQRIVNITIYSAYTGIFLVLSSISELGRETEKYS